MARRYFIDLSRKDTGLVSYFPALEVKNDPNKDWIEAVLMPAILPIVRRKTKTIREVPITFWATVRGTARYRSEVFLFTTPAYPEANIEQALSRSLQSITGGNVHAGREPIQPLILPSGHRPVFPCCQVFRGRLIRFYSTLEGHGGFYLPTIRWRDGAPALIFCRILEEAVIITDEEAEQLLVRADISTVLDGRYFRRFQQAVTTIARTEDCRLSGIQG